MLHGVSPLGYTHVCIWHRGSGHNGMLLFASVPVLNKFKRRKFLKTKNLLTGETEADPEMIKVCVLMDVLASTLWLTEY